MLRLWLILFFCNAMPALAQPVRVASGQHDGFTRLVLTLPHATDWQLGRRKDGYEFRLIGSAPAYDLAHVFDTIPRNRLAAIGQDVSTGLLHLTLACACHAIPFELRPGVVVIDLRDGPPPRGSSFENSLSGDSVAPLGPNPSFAWLNWQNDNPAPDIATRLTLPRPPDPALAGFQQTMLQEFARAATQGLIDPVNRPPAAKGTAPPTNLAQIRIGPSLEMRPASDAPPPLAADGQDCPTDGELDLGNWADDHPAADQIAHVTDGLVGEFDQVRGEELRHAVQLYLYLGFGAEARALLNAYGNPPEMALLRSLSYLVDGGATADGAFAELGQCDTAAALWATLADPNLPAAAINLPALTRAFAALPPHLRRHLGPPLAERMLTAGDPATAAALRAAIDRVPAADDLRAALMAARFTAPDDPAAADAQLQELAAAGEDLPETLISLIDLRFAQRQTVDAATVTALSSLLAELDGSPETPRIARALALAQALGGDFDGAFLTVDQAPAALGDLWAVTLDMAPDSAVIQHAISAPTATIADLPRDLRHGMALRLQSLGFADAALRWDGGIDPILTANARLSQGKPELAIAALRGQSGDVAAELLAHAELARDAPLRAASALGQAADPADKTRADAWQADWASVAIGEKGPWQAAAATLRKAKGGSGPLSRGRALVDHSATTRAALGALLDSLDASNGSVTNSP